MVPADVIGRTVNDITRELLLALSRLSPELFADIAPRNFMRCLRTGRIRILDAGSVVSEGAVLWHPSKRDTNQLVLLTATTLCYLPADYAHAYRHNQERIFLGTTMMHAVGKLVHELATNQYPLEGEDLSYSYACAIMIANQKSVCMRRGWSSPGRRNAIRHSLRRFIVNSNGYDIKNGMRMHRHPAVQTHRSKRVHLNRQHGIYYI